MYYLQGQAAVLPGGDRDLRQHVRGGPGRYGRLLLGVLPRADKRCVRLKEASRVGDGDSDVDGVVADRSLGSVACFLPLGMSASTAGFADA